MKKHGLGRRPTRLLAAAGMLIGLGLMFGAPLPAAAQGPLNPEQACRDDAFRLCNDLIPDRNKVGACLRRNARSLSRDCHVVIFGAAREYHRITHRTYRRRVYHHYYHHHR